MTINSTGPIDGTHRIRSILFLLVVLLYICSVQGTCASRNSNKISLRNLLAGAIRAAEIGGVEVFRVHNNNSYATESKERKFKEEQWISNEIQSSKSSNSHSEAISENMCATSDLAETAEFMSHCAMTDFLSSAFPDVVIRAEDEYEGYCQSREAHEFDKALETLKDYDIGYDKLVKPSDVTVWIDPLDATKAFTENLLGHVTTMVGVAVKGVPVIGVIHKPFDGKLTYWGWVNHGVSRNLLDHSPPKVQTMIVPRSQLNMINALGKNFIAGRNFHFISGPGAGYKSLELAVKNVTLYLGLGTVKKFRVCAGAAIIRSLGGVMTTAQGGALEDFGPSDSMDIDIGITATTFNHKPFYERHYKTVEKNIYENKFDDNVDVCQLIV